PRSSATARSQKASRSRTPRTASCSRRTSRRSPERALAACVRQAYGRARSSRRTRGMAATDDPTPILVVDDDEDVRTTLESALQPLGRPIRSVATAGEALAAARELRPA